MMSGWYVSCFSVGNSEKERMETLDVRMLTKSVWSYVFAQRDRFTNPGYAAFEKPLWPNCGAASVKVWERFWMRWDISAHPNNLGDLRWHDDWLVLVVSNNCSVLVHHACVLLKH
jgi:hypothetical protein